MIFLQENLFDLGTLFFDLFWDIKLIKNLTLIVFVSCEIKPSIGKKIIPRVFFYYNHFVSDDLIKLKCFTLSSS